MAASEIKTVPPTVLMVENKATVGKNIACEVHEVTYDSDKTVEVITALSRVLFMTYSEKAAAATVIDSGSGDDSALTLSTDGVIDASTKGVTVGATYDSSAVFYVTLWGYS